MCSTQRRVATPVQIQPNSLWVVDHWQPIHTHRRVPRSCRPRYLCCKERQDAAASANVHHRLPLKVGPVLYDCSIVGACARHVLQAGSQRGTVHAAMSKQLAEGSLDGFPACNQLLLLLCLLAGQLLVGSLLVAHHARPRVKPHRCAHLQHVLLVHEHSVVVEVQVSAALVCLGIKKVASLVRLLCLLRLQLLLRLLAGALQAMQSSRQAHKQLIKQHAACQA